MDDFEWIFSFFDTCFLTSLEKGLISKLFPFIKEITECFTTKTRRGYGSWPRYDKSLSDTRKILDLKGKIDKIVQVLDSSDQTREDFLKNFPKWEIKRTQNIKELRKIAESTKEVRKGCNIAKIASGGVGLMGGGAIIGSLLFPPAAPALLPTWLGGAAASALLPSIFLGAAPTVSTLAVVGGVAAAGGAVGNVGATVTELVLTEKGKDEAKEIIAEDRRRMEQLGLFGFWVELNDAVDDLFGKSTASKILEDLIDFLNNVPPILDDIQPILKPLHTCLKLILPGITKFLLVGISLASVILSIFFVVFLIRRHGWAILIHRHVLGFVSAVDAGVEITRLIAAAGLSGSELGELIPRQLAGRIAVGATAAVGIVLDIATIVISSNDLAKGSLSDEASMIFEVAKELESHLSSYKHVNEELLRCVARRLKKNDVKCWTAVVVNHVPLNAGLVDITSAFKLYLSDEAWDCILLEKLPTSGNHWLVKVPTSHAQILLRQNHINIKRERCLVMK
ncbi:unnamed protein product [Larinioides sclopetarius]|uniref:Uncharacterized protein n=1 Tax=Larinioides sclopetarius TaxID=280406 RepID=A0AAV1YZG8_9ARAC